MSFHADALYFFIFLLYTLFMNRPEFFIWYLKGTYGGNLRYANSNL